MTGGGDNGAPKVVVQVPLTGSFEACCSAATSARAGAPPDDIDGELVGRVGAEASEHAVVRVASNTNTEPILVVASCMGNLLEAHDADYGGHTPWTRAGEDLKDFCSGMWRSASDCDKLRRCHE
jgi:hypothetical protein